MNNLGPHWPSCLSSGPEDKTITVSFTNGKVSSVPVDTAIWVPKEVFERIALELKMPRDARETLMSEDRYPEQSREGFVLLFTFVLYLNFEHYNMYM